jgi:mannose-1-phosphate guanylyltransferase
MRKPDQILDWTKAIQNTNSEPNEGLRMRAVVFSGGSGAPLCPPSRKQFTKQLVDVLGMRVLLQTNVRRLEVWTDDGALADERPIVVCGSAHHLKSSRRMVDSVFWQASSSNLNERKTAPALSLAAMHPANTIGDKYKSCVTRCSPPTVVFSLARCPSRDGG